MSRNQIEYKTSYRNQIEYKTSYEMLVILIIK